MAGPDPGPQGIERVGVGRRRRDEELEVVDPLRADDGGAARLGAEPIVPLTRRERAFALAKCTLCNHDLALVALQDHVDRREIVGVEIGDQSAFVRR